MFTHYRIPYLFDYINRPGHLLKYLDLESGRLFEAGRLFSASVVCLFCNKTINAQNAKM